MIKKKKASGRGIKKSPKTAVSKGRQGRGIH